MNYPKFKGLVSLFKRKGRQLTLFEQAAQNSKKRLVHTLRKRLIMKHDKTNNKAELLCDPHFLINNRLVKADKQFERAERLWWRITTMFTAISDAWREFKWSIQRARHPLGIDSTITWELDVHLAKYIHASLNEYQSIASNHIDMSFHEGFSEYISKNIKLFKEYIEWHSGGSMEKYRRLERSGLEAKEISKQITEEGKIMREKMGQFFSEGQFYGKLWW